MNILDEICEHKREEVRDRSKRVPLSEMEKRGHDADAPLDFRRAVTAAGKNIIAEVKRASPSAGVIKEDFDPVRIAQQYQEGGAAALSVLTDEKYFRGKLEFIRRIKDAVTLPVLQKDFIISAYQIYEARAFGADCILLIVKILSDDELREFLDCATSLGLAALIEVHDEGELKRALACGAEIVGINNRNLSDFSVDIRTTMRLAPLTPEGKIIVSESGIKTSSDIQKLRDVGVNAFLIGETILRSEHPVEALKQLLSA